MTRTASNIVQWSIFNQYLNKRPGYYVLVPPLPPGQHTIHFAGSIASFGVSLDVTNNITVQ
jgi:hypothetical protein